MEKHLVPVEIKKHQSLGRFIKNKITLAVVAISNKDFEKLSDEETKLVASIINTGLIAYNKNNGNPLTDEDIKKIQERFNDLDVYTFDGESKYYEKKREKLEKKLGKKLAGADTKGFVFTPTGRLLLNKEDWEKYKRGENTIPFTKVIVHEGFHFLTNQPNNNMSRIGERLTSEGADESFIVKTFAEGRKSRVMNDPSKNGLVHYNFNSESGYGSLVSIVNMLGIMVGVNPEVSALKNDGKFVDAVKTRYGRSFFRRIMKTSNKIASVEDFNNIKHVPKYHSDMQEYVIFTITKDITDNVRSPEDAVRRLKALQAAEEWYSRILIAKRDKDTGKFLGFERDNTFENYYRRTYVRVINKLREKGFTDLREVEECSYKETQFNSLMRVDIDNIPKGRQRFKARIRNNITFFKKYYGKDDPSEFIKKEQLALYNRIEAEDKEQAEEVETTRTNPQKVSIQRGQITRPSQPKVPRQPSRKSRNDDDGLIDF